MSLKRDFKITEAKSGTALTVRVLTRSAATEIAGIHDDGALKVRLVASPAGDAAANKELVEFLAHWLGVAANKVEVVAGSSGREKLISVEGVSSDELEAKLRDDLNLDTLE